MSDLQWVFFILLLILIQNILMMRFLKKIYKEVLTVFIGIAYVDDKFKKLNKNQNALQKNVDKLKKRVFQDMVTMYIKTAVVKTLSGTTYTSVGSEIAKKKKKK